MVRERHIHPATYDAVYPDLWEGDHTIWADANTPARTATIVGGQISTFTFT